MSRHAQLFLFFSLLDRRERASRRGRAVLWSVVQISQ